MSRKRFGSIFRTCEKNNHITCWCTSGCTQTTKNQCAVGWTHFCFGRGKEEKEEKEWSVFLTILFSKHNKKEFPQLLPLPQELPRGVLQPQLQNALSIKVFSETNKDMCFPLSPNIWTRTSDAPFTTAGTFSKLGAALTNPVIYS